MSRRRKILLYALLLLLSLLSASFFLSYHTSEFTGDGIIAYFGPFRPSYRVDMPSITLDEPGEHRYSFRGLPKEDDMNFLLEVVGKTHENEPELVNLTTVIEVSLIDGKGKAICNASGMPHREQYPNSWVLGGSGGGVEWYHGNCLHFETVRGESYVLIVRIKNVDPRSPKVTLIPRLEGGGMELP